MLQSLPSLDDEKCDPDPTYWGNQVSLHWSFSTTTLDRKRCRFRPWEEISKVYRSADLPFRVDHFGQRGSTSKILRISQWLQFAVLGAPEGEVKTSEQGTGGTGLRGVLEKQVKEGNCLCLIDVCGFSFAWTLCLTKTTDKPIIVYHWTKNLRSMVTKRCVQNAVFPGFRMLPSDGW